MNINIYLLDKIPSQIAGTRRTQIMRELRNSIRSYWQNWIATTDFLHPWLVKLIDYRNAWCFCVPTLNLIWLIDSLNSCLIDSKERVYQRLCDAHCARGTRTTVKGGCITIGSNFFWERLLGFGSGSLEALEGATGETWAAILQVCLWSALSCLVLQFFGDLVNVLLRYRTSI